ncbi:hypothetical protein [Pantoea sp. 18069]|uniref:hypothetical protein n=1 Tax=Pantoea sp. 18069 TaxID=2681415 RepID=UPI001356AA0C|nr:hypothetical protein [Pantoea sp. 18069]
MNDIADLAPSLCSLLQRQGGDAASGAADRGALRCALDGGRWIGLHLQAEQQRWLVGVGCATDRLEEGVRARFEEALLRVGHESRWGLQQTGLGDGQDVELVDCDFPAAPAQLTAAAVEDQLQMLLAGLDALATGRPALPGAPQPRSGTMACGCAQAFNARMQALDASRPPGSTAAQDLLLEEQLPVRISLHPRSHHWVLEAFVGNAGALAGPLRRSLVSALLLINGAVLGGRALVCSLDGSDRVVVISRWHPDWAVRTPLLAWLDYSTRQARRIRAAAAAIAMQDEAGSRS